MLLKNPTDARMELFVINPLVPGVQKNKIRNLTAKWLLLASFVKKNLFIWTLTIASVRKLMG